MPKPIVPPPPPKEPSLEKFFDVAASKMSIRRNPSKVRNLTFSNCSTRKPTESYRMVAERHDAVNKIQPILPIRI